MISGGSKDLVIRHALLTNGQQREPKRIIIIQVAITWNRYSGDLSWMWYPSSHDGYSQVRLCGTCAIVTAAFDSVCSGKTGSSPR